MGVSAAALAGSGLFKCSEPGTAPVYQDRPCAAGADSRALDDHPAPLSVIPFVPPAERPAAKPARPPRAIAAAPRVDKRRAAAERLRSEAGVAERRHLRDGMSDAEVFARLGPPDFQAGKTGRKMRWTYLPAPGDAQTVTLIRFEDGKVIGVERSVMR